MLVDGGQVVVPKPFGPKDETGSDVFEDEVTSKLSGLGIVTHFVDDWYYHIKHGEIHCCTNARRVPPNTPWW